MKKMRLVRSVCLGLTLVAGVSLVGCGSGSDSVSSPSATSFNLKANAVTLTVVDAASGKVLSGASVSLSSSVPLYDAKGTLVTSVSATNGVATVYTASRGTISVVASKGGYLDGASEVVQAGKQTLGTISLISSSTSSTSTGITATSSTVLPSASGVVKAADLAVTTPLAQVAAAQDVSVKNASGVAVTAPITLTVAGIDVAKAVSALPGTQSVGSGSAAKPIQFAGAAILGATTGSASARVAARAAAATSGSFTFSPAIQLTLRLSANLTNPATTKPYVKGDSVGVYVLATGSVTWTDTKQRIAIREDANGLFVVVAASRTGAWGVGQLMTGSNSGSLTVALPKFAGYDVKLTFSNAGWSRSYHSAGDTVVTIPGLPLGGGLSMVAELSGSVLKSLYNQAFLNGQTIRIDTAVPTNFISVPVSLTCSEASVALPSIGAGAGFPVVFTKSGSLAAFASLSDAATLIPGLVAGTTYSYTVSLSTGDQTGSFSAASGSALVISVPCSTLGHEVPTTGASGNP